MTNPTAPLLNESEVSEIETRFKNAFANWHTPNFVRSIIKKDGPALIRDWRALKTDLKYRCESLEELRGCRDRWLTMLNPTGPG